jgi:lysine 2,3-aminomutase
MKQEKKQIFTGSRILRDQGELKSLLNLAIRDDEDAWFRAERDRLPFLLPSYYAGLINSSDSHDPIRLQAIPTAKEFTITQQELADPLGEKNFMPVEFLIHRYTSRALFLSTGTCAMYCRHCFRRNYTGKPHIPTGKQIMKAAQYLKDHTGVKELLISGGDPLTLSIDSLARNLEIFREYRPDIVFRICTRIPVVMPQMITDELVNMLAEYREKGLYVITQYNHPVELSSESIGAVRRLLDAGISVLNQTVLLKGVNDSVNVLETLMNGLVSAGVIPYYLFHPDMAEGTSHFRIPLKRGLAMYKQLTTKLSRLALPEYAVDIPGGWGKVSLSDTGIIAVTGDTYKLRISDDQVFTYVDTV